MPSRHDQGFTADPAPGAQGIEAADRARRWRLLLGRAAEEAPGLAPLPEDSPLAELDGALEALYAPPDASLPRGADLSSSQPRLARWLGDLRRHLPADVVRVVQQDALERKGLKQLLLEPELLSQLEPSVELVTTLLSLAHLIPERTREAARVLISRLAEELTRRLGEPLALAVRGALDRTRASPIHTLATLDVRRTVRHNLRHYDPATRTLGLERLFFSGRRAPRIPFRVVIALDTSGSMAGSLVHGAITASLLARLPALRTHLVLFDTAVADLTDRMADPVDVLFGVQLGGGTDIAGAVGYCATLVEEPQRTLLLLVTDLHEGGDAQALCRRLEALKARGVTCACLLALDDAGAPAFHAGLAREISSLGVATFAATPERLPDVLAAAIRGEPLQRFESG